MTVLLIDTETTGLDPATDRVIEMGWMLTDDSFNEPIAGASYLMRDESYPQLSKEIEGITGIPQALLEEQGKSVNAVMSFLEADLMEHKPDFVVAYNADFDRPMLASEFRRGAFGMLPGINRLEQTPFLCAMRDVQSNYLFKCWKLSHLALDKGVTINPSELHRALADVELMRKMLQASNESATSMYKYHQEPWIIVRAVTTPPWEDGGRSNDQARKRGFSWQKAKGCPEQKEFKNAWVKRIKERDFDSEVAALPLALRIVK